MNHSIKPGQPWLDTNGNRIQAHAGYMLIAEGKFYWYGENKEKSFSEWEIWHWGVRLYSSEDLYNWTDEGIIMLPTPDEPDNPMYPNSKMDRPHILYNDKTKQLRIRPIEELYDSVNTKNPFSLDERGKTMYDTLCNIL